MTGLAWKLNRLCAMGAREIAHRGARWAGQRLERAAVAAGYAPSPAQPVGARLSLFSQISNWQSAWQTRYSLDPENLEMLMRGRIDFFGHPPLDVGDPVDWHRDPLTGIRAPLVFGKDINYRDDSLVGNVKIIWELGRHQHLVPLAVAYAVTGDNRYKNSVVNQIDGWIRDNPYDLGIHWCSSLELSLRLISWSVVHSLIALRDGPDGLFNAVKKPELLGLSIYRQARFVWNHLSLFSSANNHLIGELTGLWTTCCVFDLGAEGDHWSLEAKAALEREARLQVHDDGVDKEQAIYYHLWVLEYLLYAWLVGERAGEPFSIEFRERIEAMAQFLRDVTPAGGKPPHVGDSDDGFVTRFEPRWPQDPYYETLSAVDEVFKSAKRQSIFSNLTQKGFWYKMIFSDSLEKRDVERPRKDFVHTYPIYYWHGGYAILGNGPAHVVFDAGPLGYQSIAAHGHADALSFCLAIDGEWWLIDPGTYSYHSEPVWRDYFKGTSAHTTLVADGIDQSRSGGAFLWLEHANAILEPMPDSSDGIQRVKGWHTGYKNIGLLHHREIQLSREGGRIKIIDTVEGTGNHSLMLYFHFAPDIELAYLTQEGYWVAKKEGSKRVVSIKVDRRWEWEVIKGGTDPILGWYSSAFGKKQPSPTMKGSWYGETPHRTETCIDIDYLK